MPARSMSARAFAWSLAATVAVIGCGARSSLPVGEGRAGNGGQGGSPLGEGGGGGTSSSIATTSSSSSGLMEMCPAGCAGPTATFPPAVPLGPTGLPATCSGGFEANNPPEHTFTVKSLSPSGAAAVTLDIDIATYHAPDHLRITGVDASNTEYVVLETCSLQTATYSDPTVNEGNCVRPPDDSIRQLKGSVLAGTTSLTFDYTGACTPTYTRVLGLCDFAVTTFFSGCQFRVIP
jgi:hypothetical protein